jgi:hypothetical protein
VSALLLEPPTVAPRAIPWPIPAPPPPLDFRDYPYLADGRVVVQLALAHAADLWGQARWHTARWSYIAQDNFADATCDVEGLSIERGRRDPLDHYSTASLTMSLFDPERRWSPAAVDAQGLRPLRVGTPIRVAAWSADATQLITLFAGVLLTVVELDDGSEPVVALTAHGSLGQLAADRITPPAGGAGELAGVRMARVVDASSLRTSWWGTSFAAGVEPLQPFEAGGDLVSPLDLLELVADSDGGALSERRDGAVIYRGAADLESDPIRARFVDSGTHSGAPSDYCPASLTFTLDASHVVNAVGVQKVGGAMVWAEDASSVSWSGRRPAELTGLVFTNDSHGPGLAQQLLDRSSRRDFAVGPVLGEALAIPGWYRAALDLELTNRVQVDRNDGQGLRVEAICRIGSVRHDITRGSWTVRYDLEDADLRSHYDRWGSARWEQALWN